MKLSHFTAEASIYRSTGMYRSSRSRVSATGVVRSQSDLPDGTYQNSCSACWVEYLDAGYILIPILHCTCPDYDGNPHQTAINSFACFGLDVANCNGQLRCGGC